MTAEFIIYTSFYIIGVVMGSFFTLATYRLPLKQDILYTRSYCPKCENKLGFWDLIPILSYIFLKGKCRYCHEKIKPRYLVIEIFSGLFYLLFVVSLKINFFEIDVFQIVKLLYGTFMISVFFIIGSIAKEAKVFIKNILNFGLIIQFIYITYLYILNVNIYRYIICFITIIILLLIQSKLNDTKKIKILNYMALIIFSLIATSNLVVLFSLIFTIILYVIEKLVMKNKENNSIFYFSFLNILFMIICNFSL